MAIVLIVSKTQMQSGVCVGGIIESTCELIRLRNERGGNLSAEAPYEIGDRWEMIVEKAWNVRSLPHIEDRQTRPIKKIGNIGIAGIISFIESHNLDCRLTKGDLSNAFEGCLHLKGTKNYINRDNIPSFSTQFWIADRELVHRFQFEKHYYYYSDMRLKFVGYQKPIDIIPPGTIIRLSLANWWNGDGSGEDRCYLQLSGWYNDDRITYKNQYEHSPWKVKDVDRLTKEEIDSIIEINVRCHSYEWGMATNMVFSMTNGKKKYVPLSRYSNLKADDKVNPFSVVLIVLCKNGEEIVRADGEVYE